MLSWEPGPALEGEVVVFVVTSLNNDTHFSNETLTNEASIFLAPPPSGRVCQSLQPMNSYFSIFAWTFQYFVCISVFFSAPLKTLFIIEIGG